MKFTSYKTGFYKQWDTKTGRNSMTGAFKGTLVGIFPKLTLQFAMQNGADRALVLKACNSDFKDVTYFDPEKKRTVTKTFYFGDVENEIARAIGNDPDKFMYKPMSVDIVATTKRS